uniref:Uncharacterized protein n=1 Tax=Octopus bimaculoides TaxID=37653 RepID=A0A0L8FT90_OCTBM
MLLFQNLQSINKFPLVTDLSCMQFNCQAESWASKNRFLKMLQSVAKFLLGNEEGKGRRDIKIRKRKFTNDLTIIIDGDNCLLHPLFAMLA